MTKKRDRLQIIYDILHVISQRNGQIKPTHILSKSNLSHQMMEEYLTELLQKQFILEQESSRGKTYALNSRGYEYLAKYKVIVEFMQSFGLG